MSKYYACRLKQQVPWVVNQWRTAVAEVATKENFPVRKVRRVELQCAWIDYSCNWLRNHCQLLKYWEWLLDCIVTAICSVYDNLTCYSNFLSFFLSSRKCSSTFMCCSSSQLAISGYFRKIVRENEENQQTLWRLIQLKQKIYGIYGNTWHTACVVNSNDFITFYSVKDLLLSHYMFFPPH